MKYPMIYGYHFLYLPLHFKYTFVYWCEVGLSIEIRCIATGTMAFMEDRLYDVLVCLVNSPFSFYVQIRDDEEVSQNTARQLKKCSVVCL